MNIVRYDGNGYFDYAKYWIGDEINCFIAGRHTGKTYSLEKGGIFSGEYGYYKGMFTLWNDKRCIEMPIIDVPYNNGVVLSFITLRDFQQWYSFMCEYINKLIVMTEPKLYRRFS